MHRRRIRIRVLGPQGLKDLCDRLLDSLLPIEVVPARGQSAASSDLRFIERYLCSDMSARPLLNCLRVAEKAGCTHLVVEHPYVDLDYWSIYSSYYALGFPQVERSCLRIHCFRFGSQEAPIDPPPTEHAIESWLTDPAQEPPADYSYLGFFVLRPTRSHVVGRACLAPTEIVSERPGRACFKGLLTATANLLGRRFSVQAVPFMQQDIVTGTCASVSCWISSEVLAGRHGLDRIRYGQVVERALRPDPAQLGYAKPFQGLTVAQMEQALQVTGAHTLRYSVEPTGLAPGLSREALLDVLYAAIESHLPVIAVLRDHQRQSLHAVAVVGHQLEAIDSHASRQRAQVQPYQGMEPGDLAVSATVGWYYCHDDSYGPYRRLQVVRPVDLRQAWPIDESAGQVRFDNLDAVQDVLVRSPSDELLAKYRCPVILQSPKRTVRDLCHLIVAMPPYVRRGADDVTAQAVEIAYQVRGRFFNDDVHLLFRTQLLESANYKQSLVSSEHGRNYGPMAKAICAQHMPKFSYLCEITAFDPDEVGAVLGQETLDVARRPVDVEMLFDASASPLTDRPFLMRVGNLLFDYRGIRRLVSPGGLAGPQCDRYRHAAADPVQGCYVP